MDSARAQSVNGVRTVGGRSMVEVVAASTIGTTIEWYDFFLYGTMAALVFPKLFFPNADPFVGQILSFTTFLVGFIARPVGAIIFGHLGDRIGRKSTLVATLLLMGISTLIIGFMPGYAQIGASAAILVSVLRFLQGLGVGGEWGGSVLLAVEHGHTGRRGFLGSWPQAGVPAGLLLSTIVVAIMSNISGDQFTVTGWRVPFYLSVILVIIGLVIRLRIFETPLFRALQAENRVARAPVVDVLQQNWKYVLLTAGTRINENACFYLFATFIASYGTTVLGYSRDYVLWAVSIAAAVELFTIPTFGYLSDQFGRKRLYMVGTAVLFVFAFPYYLLLGSKDPALALIAIILSLAGTHAMLYSVTAAMFSELFGTRLRYSGSSLGYQLTAPIAGGLSPIIATALLAQFNKAFWPIAIYIMAICVISYVCVSLLPETSKRKIHTDEAAAYAALAE
jgi:metabolite-proton symporter